MNKTINSRFIAAMIAVVVIVAVTVHFTHAWQARKQAHAYIKFADEATKAGEMRRAMGFLERYLLLFPNDNDVRSRMGMIVARNAFNPDQKYQAYFMLEKVLREDPHREDVRRRNARLAIDMRLFSAAIAHLEILQAAHPGEAELDEQLGECHVFLGDFQKAESSFAQAIAKNPTLYAAYASRAIVLRRHLVAREEEADELIGKLDADDVKSAKAHMIAASYWKEFGKLDLAEKEIAKALELAKEDAEVLLADAGVKMAEAEEFRRIGRVEPYLAKLAEAQKQVQLGIDKNSPPELNPAGTEEEQDRIAARRLLIAKLYRIAVELAEKRDRRVEAEAIAREGVSVLPEQHELVLNLAGILINARKLDDAEHVLQRLQDIGFPTAILEYERARILAARDRWMEASQLLESVGPDLVVFPEISRQAFFLLAECYDPMGEMDRRYEAFVRARPSDPHDPLWAAASLGMAGSLAEMGRAAEAIDLYRAVNEHYAAAAIPLARLLFVATMEKPADKRDWRPIEDLLKRASPGVQTELLRADLQLVRGQAADARATLERAKQTYPDAVEIWAAQAVHRLADKDVAGGEKILDDVQTHFGDKVEIRLARARLLVVPLPPDWTEKLVKLGDGLEKFARPDRRRLLRGLADRALELNSIDTASRLWDQLVKEQPDNLGTHEKRFDRAIAKGDEKTILRVLDEIRRVDGVNGVTTRMARALYLIWKGRQGDPSGLAEARDLLLELAYKRSESPRVPLALAYVYELKGDLNSAVPNYQRSITLGERDPAVMQRLIELYYDHNDLNQADAILHIAPPAVTDKETIRFIIAQISLASGNFARGVEMAERAVDANAGDWRKHLWLGQVRASAGLQKQAEISFRKAIELESSLPAPWIALIQLLMDAKRESDAKETLELACKRVKEEELALTRAQGCELLGRVDDAGKYYAKALLERPNHIPTLRGAANFRLRQVQQLGELEPVRQIVEHILQIQDKSRDDDDFARRMLAIIFSMKPDYNSSRRALELVGVFDPKSLQDVPVDELQIRARLLSFQPGRAARDQAVTILESIDARRPLQPDDRFLLAQLDSLLNYGDNARTQFTLLMRTQSNNPLYVARFAWFLIDQDGATPEADSWLKVLEKLQPNQFRTAELRSRFLIAARRPKEAVEKLTAFAGKHPDDLGPALLLEELGELAASESLLKTLVDNKVPRATRALAQFYAHRNRCREALDLLEKDTEPTTAAGAIGAILVVLYSLDKAQPEDIARARRLIEKIADKGSMLTLENAALDNLEGNYQGALERYREVLRRDPDNVQAINNVAFLQAYFEKKPKQALELVHQTRHKLARPVVSLLDTEGVVQLEMDDPNTDAAVELLMDVVTDEPTGGRYYHLARAYALAGKESEARKALEKAKSLKLRPANIHPLERAEYEEMLRKYQ